MFRLQIWRETQRLRSDTRGLSVRHYKKCTSGFNHINREIARWFRLVTFQRTRKGGHLILLVSKFGLTLGLVIESRKKEPIRTLAFTSRLPSHIIRLAYFLVFNLFLRPHTTPSYHHVQTCFAKRSKVVHISLLLSRHLLV